MLHNHGSIVHELLKLFNFWWLKVKIGLCVCVCARVSPKNLFSIIHLILSSVLIEDASVNVFLFWESACDFAETIPPSLPPISNLPLLICASVPQGVPGTAASVLRPAASSGRGGSKLSTRVFVRVCGGVRLCAYCAHESTPCPCGFSSVGHVAWKKRNPRCGLCGAESLPRLRLRLFICCACVVPTQWRMSSIKGPCMCNFLHCKLFKWWPVKLCTYSNKDDDLWCHRPSSVSAECRHSSH